MKGPRSIRGRAGRLLQRVSGAGFVLVLATVLAAPAVATPQVLVFSHPASSLAAMQAAAAQAQARIATLTQQTEVAVEAYDQAQARLDAISVQLDLARTQLQRAQNDLAARQALLAARLDAMYKTGQFSVVDIILTSRSFTDISKQIEFFRMISEQDQAAAAAIQQLTVAMQRLADQIDTRRAQALELTAEVQAHAAVIDQRLQDQRNLLAGLDAGIRSILASQQTLASADAQRLARMANVDLSQIRGTPAQIAVVRETMRYLGVPYVWGGASPRGGFDCSGLVMYVFRDFGVNLPHAATLQARLGHPVPFDRLQPADLVFFGDPSFYHHVGIYIGDGLFIEAPHTGDVVRVSVLAGRGATLACRYALHL
jgi:cell wall-associated NlpC family hydrolase